METCVEYAPTNEDILKTEHFEIWNGLPKEYQFKPAKASGGRPALRAENKGCYIWVFPDATDAYQEDENLILLAIGTRHKKRIHFTVDLSKTKSLDKLKEKVISLNTDIQNELDKK